MFDNISLITGFVASIIYSETIECIKRKYFGFAL